MTGLSGKIYEFGGFRLDLSERQLLRSGEPVSLTPKAFEVLTCLVERRGHLVERDELIQKVWSDSFVEDANLTRTVWMLRFALDDDRNGNRFIQTVPKHGYRFIADVKEISGGSVTHASTFASLAVLPLVNVSGDPSEEYLAEGVTEGLIANLSRAKELRVIAAKSVHAYRGSSKTPVEIARELNVNATVHGTFARNDGGVLVDLKLIDGTTGEILWRETYARNWGGILYLESDAANSIARRVGVELQLPPNSAREVNPDAYDLYLKGCYRLLTEHREDTNEAIALLEQAVKLDKEFAAAFAELARAYHRNAYFFEAEEKQWSEKAFIAAERANLLNPHLAEAHLARGLILWTNANGFRHEQAITEYLRAIELNPNYDEARHQLALVYHHVGLFEKASAHYQLALAINPANNLIRAHFAGSLNFQQRYDDALKVLKGVPYGHAVAGNYQTTWCLIHLKRYDEAAAIVDSALKSGPRDEGGIMTSIQALIAAHKGDERGVEEKVKTSVELGCKFGHFHHATFNFAEAYSILDRPESAMEWLQITADDGFPCYPLFLNDPDLDNIREYPGFKDFMSKQKKQWELRMSSY